MIRSLASQSVIGLSSTVSALTTRVTKVEKKAEGSATQVALDKLDSKFEVLKSSLKKNTT